MKNLTKQAHISVPIWSVPELVAFEFTMAIISALVIVTSFWVIKSIYSKERKSRSDILFATASISDIGVGLFRLPSAGLLVACTFTKFVKCSTSLNCLIYACKFFPFFSYLITTLIAIDRLLVITKDSSYKLFVTKRRLKFIVGLNVALSAGYTLLVVYYGAYLPRLRLLLIFVIVDLSVTVVLPLIIVVAYMCILCYVYRRSNAMSRCKVSGENTNKKLTKTIMLILSSQIILAFPHAFLNLSFTAKLFNNLINVNLKLYLTLFFYFFILWNCQFFLNGMIFLINQRKTIQPKKENTRKMQTKSKAAVSLKPL